MIGEPHDECIDLGHQTNCVTENQFKSTFCYQPHSAIDNVFLLLLSLQFARKKTVRGQGAVTQGTIRDESAKKRYLDESIQSERNSP